jgi:bacteriorhodopsin
MNIVNKTLIISLIVQFITFIASIDGLAFYLNKKHYVLKEIFVLETIVQAVEAFMYIWIIFAVSNLETMVQRRYIDWMITTPIMLINTIVFMDYINTLSSDKIISFSDFIRNNIYTILVIIVCNGLMLLFGYLGETKAMNKHISIFIGFIFFFIVFFTIYNTYIDHTNINRLSVNLFYFVFIVWGLYGIAALLKPKLKNICYNFLDIISKNFYGLYIYYKMIQVKE